MTNGTSQGLFIVVAIVIFGIFVLLSQTLFGDQLSNGLVSLFDSSIEQVDTNITYTKDFAVNGDFTDYREVNFNWDYSLNGNLAPNGLWSGGYNGGVENPEVGYHAHLDIETFGKPVMSFINNNHEVDSVGYVRWLGISKTFDSDSEIHDVLTLGSEVVVSFDLWSEEINTAMRVGLYQMTDEGRNRVVSGIPRRHLSTTETEKWERVEARFTLNDSFKFGERIRVYIHGYEGSINTTNYIDNVSIRVKR